MHPPTPYLGQRTRCRRWSEIPLRDTPSTNPLLPLPPRDFTNPLPLHLLLPHKQITRLLGPWGGDMGCEQCMAYQGS
jgi:hypothetical protein